MILHLFTNKETKATENLEYIEHIFCRYYQNWLGYGQATSFSKVLNHSKAIIILPSYPSRYGWFHTNLILCIPFLFHFPLSSLRLFFLLSFIFFSLIVCHTWHSYFFNTAFFLKNPLSLFFLFCEKTYTMEGSDSEKYVYTLIDGKFLEYILLFQTNTRSYQASHIPYIFYIQIHIYI